MPEVSQLPKDTGESAWTGVLPHRQARPSLEYDQTADWLIIGGGFAGLSAARRLSQLRAGSGERIVLMEARAIADGPAGRNSGFMVDLPHNLQSEDYGSAVENDRMEIRHNRSAIDFIKQARDEFDLPIEAANPIGKMNAAATDVGDRHNREYAAHLAALDEPSELLDQAQMRGITGSEHFTSGLFTPGCLMLQPGLLMRGFADAMPRQSAVEIFEFSPVLRFEQQGEGWKVFTNKGSLTVPRVILAVNGHANSFGFYKRQLMHVFTYGSMTRQLSDNEVKALGGEPVWGCTPADPVGSSVRRLSGTGWGERGGDRILIRNRFTYDSSLEVDDKRLESVARDHDRSFRARFPQLKDVEMEYCWGGRLCLSRNSVPAFGEIERNLFSAVCQNGIGTTKGTLAGIAAAEYAANGSSAIADELLAQDAPQKLPLEPIASIGANAFLRWKEFRAGKEL